MHRKIILTSLAVWVFVCIVGGFYFHEPLAGAVLVLVPVAWLFPNATGIVAYIAEPIYLAILLTLAVLAWRKRSASLTGIFCSLLLGSVIFGWIAFEHMRTGIRDMVSYVFSIFP